MINAPINKIIDLSMVDGPGNRTAVFFQGCNLSCKYCHNPETWNICNNCGECVSQCPVSALRINRGCVLREERICINCDTCIKTCRHHSSPKVKIMTVDEVYAAIIRNIPFIRGITVSGGECSLYLEFLEKLFGLCQKSGLSCLMDSNGMVPLWDKAVLNFCEGVMLDVKSWSAKYFHQLTGADNDIVLKNMEELARIGKLFEIRIVCITGIVDADEVIKGAGRRLSQEVKNQLLLKLIRFRNHGVTGEFKTFPPPSAEYMYRLKDLANENGFKKIRMVM